MKDTHTHTACLVLWLILSPGDPARQQSLDPPGLGPHPICPSQQLTLPHQWRACCIPPHFMCLPLQTSTSAPKSPTCAFSAPVPTAPEALIASAHLTLSCLTTGTVALVSLEPGSIQDEGRGGRWGGGRATSPREGTCSFLCGSPRALSGVKLSLLSRVRATDPVFVILGASGEPNPSVCL